MKDEARVIEPGEREILRLEQMIEQRPEGAGVAEQPQRIETKLPIELAKELRVLRGLGKGTHPR